VVGGLADDQGVQLESAPRQRPGEENNVGRKLLLYAVIALGVFFLLSQPQGAADAVKSALHLAGGAFKQLTEFLSSLA
jgi:hypothetical protein